MNHRETLLKAFEGYCKRTGRTESGVSNIIMNDGKFYDRVKSGGGFTIKTYETVMRWFQENAPKGKAKTSEQ
jgi:hypothetical protein